MLKTSVGSPNVLNEVDALKQLMLWGDTPGKEFVHGIPPYRPILLYAKKSAGQPYVPAFFRLFAMP
jgi:hypothetical protein